MDWFGIASIACPVLRRNLFLAPLLYWVSLVLAVKIISNVSIVRPSNWLKFPRKRPVILLAALLFLSVFYTTLFYRCTNF